MYTRHGFTYYHKFNDKWHLSYELYDLYRHDVLNISNPAVQGYIANDGTPFSPQVEIRPEVDYDHSLDRAAFNGNPARSVTPERKYTILGAADVVLHY